MSKNQSFFQVLFARKGRLLFSAVIVVIVAIGAVGVISVITFVNAAPASLEVEAGTKTANTSTVSDTTASGGSAVKFSVGSGEACSGILSGGACYPTPPGPLASGKTWNLTFNDEFSDTTLDATKWTPCFDWNYGGCSESFNQGRERYMPSQVRISGGTAKLVAEPLSPPYSSAGCYQGSCTYKSGLISTARPRADDGSDYRYKFTYGYVEGRLKVPPTRGFFTAFWMLPASPSYDYDYEIDILEFLGGDNKTAFMTYHYNGRTQSHAVNNGDFNNGSCSASQDLTTDFVRYGMDWQPTYVAWYINGVKCGQYNGATSNVPMQLILDLMIDHQWSRDWGLSLQNQSAVDQLEADYIRVYQQQ